MGAALGQDPFALRRRWDRRKLRAALVWLGRQWNQPTLTEYYLMQVCRTVREANVRRGTTVRLDDFRIPFAVGGAARPPISEEEMAMDGPPVEALTQADIDTILAAEARAKARMAKRAEQAGPGGGGATDGD